MALVSSLQAEAGIPPAVDARAKVSGWWGQQKPQYSAPLEEKVRRRQVWMLSVPPLTPPPCPKETLPQCSHCLEKT